MRWQLLLGVLAVVTIVLVAVGGVSVLSLRGYVTAMNDAEVVESMHAFSHAYARYRNGEHTSIHTGTPPLSQALLEFTGQTPGNLIAVMRDGVVIGSAVFSEDAPARHHRMSSTPSRPNTGPTNRHVSKRWAAWVPIKSTAAPPDPTA
ncbi:putative two component system sensor histidine kinase trcS [Mycobacterium ulcerans str. Harvey]|uniref:Two component system sensor histidine kinase trcS n=1 Tax=Mycobacterium ulcerans str. Harvey TaxID=1299332 RepID=A0ABN0QMQ6_MYCUL|nr:putative two component system sensor histidine kinase trcS [Mycobacterium ulcerans str. Harvey]